MDTTDIFAYAMKMETDGRDFYLKQAEKASQEQFKKIWLQLAEDELKHYNIFKALRDGESAEYNKETETTILTDVKNIFEEMKDSGEEFHFEGDIEKAWTEAREVERKSEDFYREKANDVDTKNKAEILNRIADEEHKHFVTLDNVIQFLTRPKQWLEDAEWNNMKDY